MPSSAVLPKRFLMLRRMRYLVALELQDGVYDMLQYFGAGEGSLLINMSNEDDGCVALLGEAQNGGGAFPHLRDAAGG